MPLGHCEYEQGACTTISTPLQAAKRQRESSTKQHWAKPIFRRGLTPAKLLTRSSQGKGTLWCVTAEPCLSVGQEGISQLL